MNNFDEIISIFALNMHSIKPASPHHTQATAASPCVGYCTTVLGDDVCRSCHRTFEEITHWVGMSDAERIQVNQRIATKKQTMEK